MTYLFIYHSVVKLGTTELNKILEKPIGEIFKEDDLIKKYTLI